MSAEAPPIGTLYEEAGWSSSSNATQKLQILRLSEGASGNPFRECKLVTTDTKSSETVPPDGPRQPAEIGKENRSGKNASLCQKKQIRPWKTSLKVTGIASTTSYATPLMKKPHWATIEPSIGSENGMDGSLTQKNGNGSGHRKMPTVRPPSRTHCWNSIQLRARISTGKRGTRRGQL